jgi:hypothetical protein
VLRRPEEYRPVGVSRTRILIRIRKIAATKHKLRANAKTDGGRDNQPATRVIPAMRIRMPKAPGAVLGLTRNSIEEGSEGVRPVGDDMGSGGVEVRDAI